MTLPVGAPLVGAVLDDRYQIVKRVARGGSATVYEAFDGRLARSVAVKVMNAGLSASESQHFVAEARAAAKLSHPNVVGVFDTGTDAGRPYIVMEYVRGITLRQLIMMEAPFAPDRALALAEPIAAALAAAHDAGLVHRDVKPENVLLGEQGAVKVADFGLASAVNGGTVSHDGIVMGTVSYIAPELIATGLATPRADVYSFGVMLYEFLTGQKPYRGEAHDVVSCHLGRDMPLPSALVSGLPPFLDTLVQTTTRRDLPARAVDARLVLAQVRAARTALRLPERHDDAVEALMAASTQESFDAARPRAIAALNARRGGARVSVPSPRGVGGISRADAARRLRTITPGQRGPVLRPVAASSADSRHTTTHAVPAATPSVSGSHAATALALSAPAPASLAHPDGEPIEAAPRPQLRLVVSDALAGRDLESWRVGPPSTWSPDPVYRRRRLAVLAASLLMLVALALGVASSLMSPPPAPSGTSASVPDGGAGVR